MSRKGKGMNVERELVHKFWGDGWCAVRIAGSGSMRYPSADILATNKLRKLAIECKSSKKKKKYLTKDEIDQLRLFSKLFNAEPWIGVRFDKESWYFLDINDLDKTEENFVVSLDLAKEKGFLFEELIDKK